MRWKFVHNEDGYYYRYILFCRRLSNFANIGKKIKRENPRIKKKLLIRLWNMYWVNTIERNKIMTNMTRSWRKFLSFRRENWNTIFGVHFFFFISAVYTGGGEDKTHGDIIFFVVFCEGDVGKKCNLGLKHIFSSHTKNK